MEVRHVKKLVRSLLERNFTIFRIPKEVRTEENISNQDFARLLYYYYSRSLITPENQLILTAILKSKSLSLTYLNSFITHLATVSLLVDPLLRKYHSEIKKGIYLLFKRSKGSKSVLDLIVYDLLRVSENKKPVFADWTKEFFKKAKEKLFSNNFRMSYFDLMSLFEFWLLKILKYSKAWVWSGFYPIKLWSFSAESLELDTMRLFLGIRDSKGELKITNSDQFSLELLNKTRISLDIEAFEEKAAEVSGLYQYFSTRIYFKILSDIFYRRLLLTYFDEVEKTYDIELASWNFDDILDFDATIASFGTIKYPFLYGLKEIEGNTRSKKVGSLTWFLIIDSSGSMSGEKFNYACSLARGFALFAKKQNIDTKVIYFSHVAKEGRVEDLINFKSLFIGASTYINSVIEVLKKHNLKDSQFFIFSDCMWQDFSIRPLIDFLKDYDIFLINVGNEVSEAYVKEKGGVGLYYFTLRELLKVRRISRYLFKRIL